MHPILSPQFERTDSRGVFRELLNEGTWESLLTGTMNAGAVMGNHYHRHTRIYFYLASGAVRIRTIHVETGARDTFRLAAGQAVILQTDESHAIEFVESSSFIMLKSRRYRLDDPDTYPYDVPVE